MKFKTGDRVKFLNDVGEGVLISFIDKNKALVRIDDGFEIPVMISELVNFGGDYFTDKKEDNQFSVKPDAEEPVYHNSHVKPERKAGSIQEMAKIQSAIDDEIVFAAKPSLKHSGLNTWLVNSSSWIIKYVISQPIDDGHLLFAEGVLEPETKVFLRKFEPGNLNDLTGFDFQIIFYKETVYKQKDPVSGRVYFEAASVYNGKDLKQNDYFNGKAAIVKIVDFKNNKILNYPDISDLSKINSMKNDGAIQVKKQEPNIKDQKIEEVDLHIENLVDNHGNLTNGEIVDIQMSRFKTALETAIIHKTLKIVFIHGVGNGKLKFEIRKSLDKKYPALQYQDASFKEYGFGATMVLIK